MARKTPFLKKHALQYGVRPCERSTGNNGRVISAECLFCIHFCREQKPGSKRARTANIKYYTSPFRADNYTQHLKTQHSERWQEYQGLSVEEQKTYFDQAVPIKKTLHGHFGSSQMAMHYTFNGPIIDKIIGEMLWDPDDIDGQSHASMMMPFQDIAEESENLRDGEGVDRYRIVIKNRLQYNLAVKYMAASLSFRQTARILQDTKETTGLASIGSISDSTVAKYARFSAAINLQKIAELMQKSWTFSLALDMSTHMSVSYLDIRLRLYLLSYGIINVHFLAIPVYERHTGEVIFLTAAEALDAVCPEWRAIIVGGSSDGETKMTGCNSGCITRFEREAMPGFIRVWCGGHQFDLVLQGVYVEFGDEEFYQELTTVIGYLRRQQNLIKDMKTTCPKLADTRWESMATVSRWFMSNRVDVRGHMDQKNPQCKPSPKWWIYIMVLVPFAERAKITFKKLQGHEVTVSMQRGHLESVKLYFMESVQAEGPFAEGSNAADDLKITVVNGCFLRGSCLPPSLKP